MPTPLFFFTDPATTDIYTLSLHDALPISFQTDFPAVRAEAKLELARVLSALGRRDEAVRAAREALKLRSEEHTSELQSHSDLVCRLLLEKKKQHLLGHARQPKNRAHPITV